MTVAALISLRETFEASLVVCVVLALLRRTGRHEYKPAVWLGIGAGAGLSICFALLLTTFSEHLPPETHDIYTGFIVLTAALLLLWMIVWMASAGRDVKSHIEHAASTHIAGGSFLGIFLISFTAAAREGFELVLLVYATSIGTGTSLHALAGVGLGVTGAILMAALLLRGIRLIPMRLFFTATTVLLILLGSGLAMQGVGLVQSIWSPDVTRTLLELEVHEEMPSLASVAGGLLYAISAVLLWRHRSRVR